MIYIFSPLFLNLDGLRNEYFFSISFLLCMFISPAAGFLLFLDKKKQKSRAAEKKAKNQSSGVK